MFIYSIYDAVAEEYSSNLIVAKNDGVATRIFENSMKGIDEKVKKDLKLVSLGKFYSNTGKIYSEIKDVMPTSEGSTLDEVVAEITKPTEEADTEN